MKNGIGLRDGLSIFSVAPFRHSSSRVISSGVACAFGCAVCSYWGWGGVREGVERGEGCGTRGTEMKERAAGRTRKIREGKTTHRFSPTIIKLI